MEKLSFKYLFPILVFCVSITLIFFALLLNFEKKREEEALRQRILAEIKILEEEKRKEEEKNYLMGKFEPSKNEDFVLIPSQYLTEGKIGTEMYLRKEVLEAFIKMRESALLEKIDLKIASATRNFDYQKNLWEKKWTGYTLVNGKDLSKTILNGLERFKKILEYSAAPGTSRHHLGTDIDINDANLGYFEKAHGKVVYEWLVKNATSFGFCQPYTSKGDNRLNSRITGYNEEKWHWSYLPTASPLIQKYKELINNENIKGFLGSEYAPQINLIDDYVLGVNPSCL